MVHLSDNVKKMDYRAFYKVVFRIWSFYHDVFVRSDVLFWCDFIMLIYVNFVWNKRGIMWFYDIFLLWIFSFLLRYIHIIFIWLIYNLLAIDLFLSDCSIIMVLFFMIIVWFFVSCFFWFIVMFLVDILILYWFIMIDMILYNTLYYKGL